MGGINNHQAGFLLNESCLILKGNSFNLYSSKFNHIAFTWSCLKFRRRNETNDLPFFAENIRITPFWDLTSIMTQVTACLHIPNNKQYHDDVDKYISTLPNLPTS